MRIQVSFLLFAILTISFQASAQSDIEIINQTVDAEEVASHIWFLASDELKGRNTGSEEIDIAASYIESRLRSYGVKPFESLGSYYQIINLQSVKPPASASFIAGRFKFESGSNLITMEAEKIGEQADIVFSEYGLPEELNAKDLSDKIIVCKAGSPDESNPRQFFSLSTEKRKAASAAGAVALIEIYNSNGLPWPTLMNYMNREQIREEEPGNESQIPHAWISDPQLELYTFLKENGGQKGEIKMESMEKKAIPSKNVVGYIEGIDPLLKEEYVLLSAHYDHVGFKTGTMGEDSIFNGARDNATGVAAILAAAKSLSINPSKRSIIILACTGEEKGLIGSRYFAEHPPVSLNKIVFNLNSDGGGYNDITKAGIMGLTRTNAEHAMTSACEDFGLGTIADPAPEQNLFDRSDNVSFARLGIPAPTFSTGFTSFDEEIRKYYHQVTDNPESLDFAYLDKFFRAFALASRRIADMEEKPFWNKGDKYEEAGKKLYGLE